MILLRKNPVKIIRSVESNLRKAVMNFLTARNMAERIRSRKVDELLIQTAFAGMPIPSKMLAEIYLRAGADYVSKAIKYLNILEDLLKSRYYHIYSITISEKLNNAIQILSELYSRESFKPSDIDNAILKIEDVMVLIKEVESEISRFIST